MSAVSHTVCWQAGFLNILPAVQTHARIRFRKLRAEKREEAVQEAIAAACVAYRLLAAQGKLGVAHPGTLADFATRHVSNGRHVGGHQDGATDPLSPNCHKRHGITVRSYNVAAAVGGTDGWLQVAMAHHRKDPIPDTAAFRIDFATFLRTLNRRDRRIIAAMTSGNRTMAVAKRFGISEGRVSQLRRKYEAAWRCFQGELGYGRCVA